MGAWYHPEEKECYMSAPEDYIGMRVFETFREGVESGEEVYFVPGEIFVGSPRDLTCEEYFGAAHWSEEEETCLCNDKAAFEWNEDPIRKFGSCVDHTCE